MISLKLGLGCSGAVSWPISDWLNYVIEFLFECFAGAILADDLSFIPSNLLVNFIPEGLISEELLYGQGLRSISLVESFSALPLYPTDGGFSKGEAEAAFYETPILSERLSSLS